MYREDLRQNRYSGGPRHHKIDDDVDALLLLLMLMETVCRPFRSTDCHLRSITLLLGALLHLSPRSELCAVNSPVKIEELIT